MAFIIAQYAFNFRHIQQLNQQSEERLDNLLIANLQISMRFAMATKDLDAIVSIIDKLMENKMIWAIEVQDENGLTLERHERTALENKLSLEIKKIVVLDYRAPLILDETTYPKTRTPILLGTIFIHLVNDDHFGVLSIAHQKNALIFAVITLFFTLFVVASCLNQPGTMKKSKPDLYLS